ncbi:MAG: ester cyclase, partial [Bacteroidota bacterium]
MEKLAKMVKAFNELVASFQYEKAHNKFYHEELVKHENEDAPTIGLEAHRKEMMQFLAKITRPSAKLLSLIVSDDISITEWHYQFDHQEWGKRDFKEVSIQRWKAGKIIHERHLY